MIFLIPLVVAAATTATVLFARGKTSNQPSKNSEGETSTNSDGKSNQTSTNSNGKSNQISTNLEGKSSQPSLNSKYELHEKIGQGGFGTVYRVTDKNTNKIFAAKLIEITENNKSTKRELSVFSILAPHKNIMQIFDKFENDPIHKCDILVISYCENGTVNKRILEEKSTDIQLIKRFMRDILSGIAHLHEHKIIHMDLKPDNFLLDRNDCVKISDFGIAKAFSYTQKTVASLYYYNNASPGEIYCPEYFRPPEVILARRNYTQCVKAITLNLDIHQAGCSFIAMILKTSVAWGDKEQLLASYITYEKDTKKMPLAEAQLQKHYDKKIKKMFQKIGKIGTKKLKEMLQNMTQSDPNERPNAKAAIELLEKI